MTTDEAENLLATLTLNGGAVRKTAREVGVSPGTVSKLAKKAGVAVALGSGAAVPENGNVKKRDYAEIWGKAEVLAVEKGVALVAKARTPKYLPAVATFAGIAADKRYREEHPAFGGQAGAVEELVVALMEARRRRLVEGSARITDAEVKDA